MEHTLKPCPFCGSEAKTDKSRPSAYCPNTECMMVGYDIPLDDWNTRPIEDELIEALIECENWIRNDEVSHGRDFSAGIHAREALKNAGEL